MTLNTAFQDALDTLATQTSDDLAAAFAFAASL